MRTNRNLSDSLPVAAGLHRIALAAALAVTLPGSSLMAANILTNPGMDDSPNYAGWTPYGRTGQDGWYSYAIAYAPDPVLSAPNAFKTYAGWNGDPNFNGVYQDNPCLPGSTFTADGSMLSKSDDAIVGTPGSGNTAWLEVTFRDAAGTILELYRSEIFDQNSGTDDWVFLSVENRIDQETEEVAEVVTELVAPAGTTVVRFQVVLKQEGNTGGGAVLVDDMFLDQVSGPQAPVISDLAPATMLMVDPAAGIVFNATGPGGTPIEDSGIQMTVNGTDVSDALVITGTPSDKQVAYNGLVPDTVYQASITVTDTLGLSATATTSFDTYHPVLLWEAEDYNYDGGLFIDDPDPNAFFGYEGFPDIDYFSIGEDGERPYRGTDGIATPVSGDLPRAEFVAAGATDYKVGWYDAGEWVNYTRTFPAGRYNVYGRLSGGGGQTSINMSRVVGDPTQVDQDVEPIGKFRFEARGWNTYDYVPLTDAFGNLISVDLEGETTVRMTANGGADMSFFMLLPARASVPAIVDVFPNGDEPFQQASAFTFRVTSEDTTLPDDGIRVTLNGVDATERLQISGTSTAKDVALAALLPNVLYTAVIEVTDANDTVVSTTVRFDTFSQSLYMVEAEDYDFDGGQFIDDPAPTPAEAEGSYRDRIGTGGIDYGDTQSNGDKIYRTLDSMATPVANDFRRQKFLDASTTHGVEVRDYKIGWFDSGEWVNYTRTYPAGEFRVYGRLAGNPGQGYSLYLDKVTDGVGTETQTTERLGRFGATGSGWDTYAWVLLRDVDLVNPVTLQLGGEETLRLTTTSNNDPNFFMLVPATSKPLQLEPAVVGGEVQLAFETGAGVGYEVLYKDDLAEPRWKLLTTLTGDGSTMTVSDPRPGTERFYVLSMP